MKKTALALALFLLTAMCASATVSILWSWDRDGGGGGNGIVQDHLGGPLGSNRIVQLIWSPDAAIGPLDPENPLVPTGGDQVMATRGTPGTAGWWLFDSLSVGASNQYAGGYVYQRVFDVPVGSTPAMGSYYRDGVIVTGPLADASLVPAPPPDVSFFFASGGTPLRVDMLIGDNPNTCTLTYTAGANGTISGISPQTVNYGAAGSAVTAVADTGCHFVQWSDGVTTATRSDTDVTVSLSVTAIFAEDAPAIQVIPSTCDFGSIQVGTTADRTFTVQNVGGGILAGTATVPAPYSIITGAAYSLGSGVSQVVTVRYSPAAAGSHAETVTLTGGSGASCSVTGSAHPAPVLTVTPQDQTVDAEAGTTAFVVTNTGGGTLSYMAAESESWLSISAGGSGTNNGTVTVAYGANPDAVSRTGAVTVTAAGIAGSPKTVTVTQAGTTAPAVSATRVISGSNVVITVVLPAGCTSWSVEETLPAGLTPFNIAPSDGVWNEGRGKLSWIFLDGTAHTLSYTLGASGAGTYTLAGVAIFNPGPLQVAVGGDAQWSFDPFLHPADVNSDWEVDLVETMQYIAAYQTGQSWPRGPNPPTLMYVMVGINCYQRGPEYTHNGGGEPQCWQPVVQIAPKNAVAAGAAAGTVNREIVSGTNVAISVLPSAGVTAVAVEEILPAGLVPVNVQPACGVWNAARRRLSWIFLDGTARTLAYSAAGTAGDYTISGTAVFGVEQMPVPGATRVMIPGYNVPTEWLLQYGLTNFNADTMRDVDNDGMLTWQEWVAGCNPTDACSVFRFAGAEMTSAREVVIRWPSISNRFYNLSRAANLFFGTNDFTILPGASNIPATPAENVYTDTLENIGPYFYRIDVRE